MTDWVPVGVDFSPSSTGLVLGASAGSLLYHVAVWTPSPDGVKASWRERRGAAAVVAMGISLMAVKADCGMPFVVMEDYASGKFGSGSSHIEIAESRGFLLEEFLERGWPFVLIHPMRLKSFIHAKNKDETILRVKVEMAARGCPALPKLNARQLGDVCDAFVLWLIGMEVLHNQQGLPPSWVTGDSALGLPRNSYYEPFLEDR